MVDHKGEIISDVPTSQAFSMAVETLRKAEARELEARVRLTRAVTEAITLIYEIYSLSRVKELGARFRIVNTSPSLSIEVRDSEGETYYNMNLNPGGSISSTGIDIDNAVAHFAHALDMGLLKTYVSNIETAAHIKENSVSSVEKQAERISTTVEVIRGVKGH